LRTELTQRVMRHLHRQGVAIAARLQKLLEIVGAVFGKIGEIPGRSGAAAGRRDRNNGRSIELFVVRSGCDRIKNALFLTKLIESLDAIGRPPFAEKLGVALVN